MKKILVAIVPPTYHTGSCKILGSKSFYLTAKQDVLSQYNLARQHDGIEPVRRMPKGTAYKYKIAFGIV